jgi:hypothetical protein
MNHIKQEEGNSWCGAPLDTIFHFKEIEQVIINNFHGERSVCLKCVCQVIAALVKSPTQLTAEAQNGITVDNYGSTI